MFSWLYNFAILEINKYTLYLSYLYCRCKEWIRNIAVESVRNVPWQKLSNGSYRVCQLHFEDWCFMNVEKKNSLVHNAVPRVFDIPHPPKLTPIRPPPKLRTQPPPSKSRKQGEVFYSYVLYVSIYILYSILLVSPFITIIHHCKFVFLVLLLFIFFF